MTKRLLTAIAALLMIGAPALLAPAHAAHVDTVPVSRVTHLIPSHQLLTH